MKNKLYRCPHCDTQAPVEELEAFTIYGEESVQCNECGCIEPVEGNEVND